MISEGKTTAEVMEATGYSRGWIQQLARRYNADGPEALGDRRHRNPGAKERALLTKDQQKELAQALMKPPEDGGMWNSRKVGEWIERRTGRAVSNKKQRGWEYLKKLRGFPKGYTLSSCPPTLLSCNPQKGSGRFPTREYSQPAL